MPCCSQPWFPEYSSQLSFSLLQCFELALRIMQHHAVSCSIMQHMHDAHAHAHAHAYCMHMHACTLIMRNMPFADMCRYVMADGGWCVAVGVHGTWWVSPMIMMTRQHRCMLRSIHSVLQVELHTSTRYSKSTLVYTYLSLSYTSILTKVITLFYTYLSYTSI